MAGISTISDEDFLLSRFHSYFGGEMNDADRKRYDELLKAEKNQEQMDKLKRAFGKLQLAFQGYYLTEDQRVGLHDIVEDSQVRKTREVEKIDQIGRWEALGDFRRRVVIIGLVVVASFSAIYLLMPEEKPSFDALESLGYEALAMEEDPEGRLDLPSKDIAEIGSYFQGKNALGFSAKIPTTLPTGWEPEGATVIDYDTAKVVTVQFFNPSLEEKAFFFAFKGKLVDLPKSTPGNYKGFIYQTYATDQLNMVVWSQGNGVLGMMVGHRSAPDLAAFVAN
jgi:hypothetical protein